MIASTKVVRVKGNEADEGSGQYGIDHHLRNVQTELHKRDTMVLKKVLLYFHPSILIQDVIFLRERGYKV